MRDFGSVCRIVVRDATGGLRQILKEFQRLGAAFIDGLSPAQLVFGGYLLYVVTGWLLLCLPVSQKTAAPSALDHLFTSMSAVSTTGLTTVSTSDDYTFFGQLVVLCLIQLGGIGYMTLGSFVILSRRPELSNSRLKAARAVFSLPESFRLNDFLKSVVRFTLAIESIGAVALYVVFRRAGAPDAAWSAVFHSVSAFCPAGFGLYNNSFESYAGHFWLNVIIACLSYLGGIGFIVCVDFWNKWTGRSERITLTSKIIVAGTFWLSAVGTVLVFATEPSLQGTPAYQRLLESFFQVMTALTTVGFNTVHIAGLSKATVLLLIAYMVVGASPSGTGGGIKVTTFTAMLGVVRTVMHGEREVRFAGRIVPLERVLMAVASFGFYLMVLVVGVYLLDLTERTPFDANFFEAASALGTVGLSMGITAGLSPLGKAIIILMMFVGRLGPITFGTALFIRKYQGGASEVSDSDLAV